MIDSYKIQNERYQDYKTSKDYWEIGKGLQAVDNLKTSKYLDVLIEDNLTGRKSYDQVENEIREYHLSNKEEHHGETEADLSATRIAKLLNETDFRLTKDELLYTHSFIFKNSFPQELEKYVGKFRDCNISKEEPILDGKSVIYTNYERINDYLEYDLNEENNRIKNERIDNIPHLTKFVSNIWNIHPFREGNTRTIAAYLLRYLRKNGFNVNNDLFKNNSKYFRNALVLASDNETKKEADYSYLESFFIKLLVDESIELKDELNIQ